MAFTTTTPTPPHCRWHEDRDSLIRLRIQSWQKVSGSVVEMVVELLIVVGRDFWLLGLLQGVKVGLKRG